MSIGRLVRKSDGTEVPIGSTLSTSDGDEYELIGFRKPHKPSSSGRVYVKMETDTFETALFPHVFGLEIIDHEFSE